MKRLLTILLCIAFCLAAACTKPAPQAELPTEAPAEPTEAPAEPTEAPTEPTEAPAEPSDEPAQQADLAFSTTTLSGEAIASDSIKDYDLIIVNFWAEWCGPCVGEMPALEKIHQEYPNVLILGAWVGDSLDEALDTVRNTGVTYPVVKVGDTLIDYAGRSIYIPMTYFFDKEGNEIGSVVGSMEYDDWKSVVEGLLQ